MGRPGKVEGTRELLVPKYPCVVAYVEREGVVTILRILHTSVKWPKKL